MKKYIVGSLLCAALFTGSLFAKPVPQDELDRVNQFISKMTPGERYSFSISNVEENDAGAITAMSVNVEIGETGAFSVTLDISEDITASLKGSTRIDDWLDEDSEETPIEKLLEVTPKLLKVKKLIEAMGFYKIESSITIVNSEDITATFKVLPVSDEAVSIKSLETTVTFLSSTKTVSGEATAVLPLDAAITGEARTSLTSIFNALRDGKEPSEEDMRGMMMVWAKIAETLETFSDSIDEATDGFEDEEEEEDSED